VGARPLSSVSFVGRCRSERMRVSLFAARLVQQHKLPCDWKPSLLFVPGVSISTGLASATQRTDRMANVEVASFHLTRMRRVTCCRWLIFIPSKSVVFGFRVRRCAFLFYEKSALWKISKNKYTLLPGHKLTIIGRVRNPDWAKIPGKSKRTLFFDCFSLLLSLVLIGSCAKREPVNRKIRQCSQMGSKHCGKLQGLSHW